VAATSSRRSRAAWADSLLPVRSSSRTALSPLFGLDRKNRKMTRLPTMEIASTMSNNSTVKVSPLGKIGACRPVGILTKVYSVTGYLCFQINSAEYSSTRKMESVIWVALRLFDSGLGVGLHAKAFILWPLAPPIFALNTRVSAVKAFNLYPQKWLVFSHYLG